MDISVVWAFVLGFGILLFPETPRFDYRRGKIDRARIALVSFPVWMRTTPLLENILKEMEEIFWVKQAGGETHGTKYSPVLACFTA